MHELLLELDRLEELLELMGELGVSNRAEVEARLAELNRRVDALEGEGDGAAEPGGDDG
jgi:hypothetical protein